MASFTDKFEYANGDLDFVTTDAWKLIDTSLVDQGVDCIQTAAVNDSIRAARAVYQTTVPTTSQQECAAFVTAFEEDSTNAYVDIGVGGLTTPDTFATDPLGVYARLHWKADGVRTLSIRHLLRNGTDTEAGSVDLMTAGSVEVSGFEGVLNDSGSLGELQLLRLIVTTDDFGMWARAYVNTKSDSEPTLIARVSKDFITPTASATDFGSWWFGFGPASAGQMLLLTDYYGADYATSDDLVPQTLRDDQVTLSMLRERVRTRYEKQAQTSLHSNTIDGNIRDEVEQILNEIGEAAWFMQRTDTTALTPNSLGEVTLSPYMRNVIGMRVSSTNSPVRFHFQELTTAGAPVLVLGNRSATTYDITYRIRHTQMQNDTDVCPIPREHTELVVIGACVRQAEVDRNKGVLDGLLARRSVLMRLLMRDQNRYADQSRQQMLPRRQGPVYRRRFYLSRWGY